MKKANSKTYYRSGAGGAPEAKNTAPKPKPKRSIAGYGSMNAAGLSSGTPKSKRTAKGYGKTGTGYTKVRGSGGSSTSGPRVTKTAQGTNAPSFGSGPGGMGRTGKGAPWGR